MNYYYYFLLLRQSEFHFRPDERYAWAEFFSSSFTHTRNSFRNHRVVDERSNLLILIFSYS